MWLFTRQHHCIHVHMCRKLNSKKLIFAICTSHHKLTKIYFPMHISSCIFYKMQNRLECIKSEPNSLHHRHEKSLLTTERVHVHHHGYSLEGMHHKLYCSHSAKININNKRGIPTMSIEASLCQLEVLHLYNTCNK